MTTRKPRLLSRMATISQETEGTVTLTDICGLLLETTMSSFLQGKISLFVEALL